ncbi:MAG: DUF1572 domain-containing protein [Crocinitomicaceae bacterium]|nr:DUF1572 domain-containing protein [Crocinitomicaceae bacterium]
MDSTVILEDFKKNIVFRLNESLRFVRTAFEELSETEVWIRPNDNLSAIGNLVLHICGNMRQYGIDSLMNYEDNRERDTEFSQTSGLSKNELLNMLALTVEEVINSMDSLSPQEMMQKRSVQGFEFTGMGNLIHLTEHLSYHTGQITYAVKLLKNKDLGFYNGFDLNTKNKKNVS